MSHHRFRARNGFDAEGQRSVALGDPLEWNDPLGRQDFVPRDWILERANYTALAGRVGDLPVDSAATPIRNGATYLIKYLYNGEQLSRLAVWDDTLNATGGIAHITADVDPADVANIINNAGAQFGGEVYQGGNNDAVFDVTYNANGTLTINVTTAGTGYSLGEVYDHNGLANLTNGVHFIVDRLTGIKPYGGWRYVDIESWVKPLVADADVATNQQEGDFQSTTETGHKELKIWHNNAWITLFSEDTIKGWIAALSLFEGTVEPEDGTSAGAIKFDALPDLQLLTSAGDRTRNSHYWTYVGAPNFVVHTEYVAQGLTNGVPSVYRWNDGAGSEFVIRDVDGTHAAIGVATLAAGVTNGQVFTVPPDQAGAGSSGFTFTVPDITKPATPMIGGDLDGAILNPGDWVQIADRGTGGTIDLHWVTVGGDLLAKARGDKLFGLQTWVDGGWEKGSLVVHNNTIYRAKAGVVGGDAAPGAGTGVAQKSSVFITGPVVAGTTYAITIDGTATASYISVAGDGTAGVIDGLIKAVNSTAATVRLMAAGPHATMAPTAAMAGMTLTGQTPGTTYQVVVSPLAGSPTATNVLAAQTDVNAVAPTSNNWEKVDLSGGVRWVMTDGDLPSQAPAGELYFILSSPQYGGGAGALVYFDAGANKWMTLGGSGGRALDLSAGLVVYPRTYYMSQAEIDAGDPEPAGRIKGDLLIRGTTGHPRVWDGTQWVFAMYGAPFGEPANAGKFTYIDSNGNLALSSKTFAEELRAQVPTVLAVTAPATRAPVGSSSSIQSVSMTPLRTDGGQTYRQIRYLEGLTSWVLYLNAPNHVAGDHLTVDEHWQLTVTNDNFNKLSNGVTWNWDASGKYFYSKISHWDDNNRQKSGTMGHATLDLVHMGDHLHIFYRMEWTRNDGNFCTSKGELFIRGQTSTKRITGFDLNAFTGDGLKYYDIF